MKKIINKVLLILFTLIIFTSCSNQSNAETDSQLSGVIKTGGSTSVEKVINALIYQFQEDNREVTINYEANGSGDGIKNTISGMYEIGYSSRELKNDGSEDGLEVTSYAIDGIAVVLNKDNKIENLTKEEIKDIYTGKITNWKEVGGKDALITVITRENGSGTRSAFGEIIGLEKKDDESTKIVSSATVAGNTGAVQTTVNQNPNSIGYMSFSEVDTEKIKPVKYEGIEISSDTLRDDSYKLKREFYILTKKDEELTPVAKAFKEFIMSDAGQKIVEANDVLPIK